MATSARMSAPGVGYLCMVCDKSNANNHAFHASVDPQEVWYGGFSWHTKCFDHSRLAYLLRVEGAMEKMTKAVLSAN